MSSHIVVVFYDDDHTYLAGCVSLVNQVNFAQSSNALALVVGSEGKISSQINESRRGKIPVIMLNDNQTGLLKSYLAEASRQSSVARLEIRYPSSNSTKMSSGLRLQVLKPTVINIGLFVFLILMVIFTGGLIFIKMKWRTEFGGDAHLRQLAKAALDKMEIRKFVKSGGFSKNRRRFRKNKWLCFIGRQTFSILGSLYSVAGSCGGQDHCTICLEEYRNGQELRVLFCGHEFHSKCVDPWLLSNRRCPLCQFDVVYKRYPQTTRRHPPKINSLLYRPPTVDCALQLQEAPLLPFRNTTVDMSQQLATNSQHANICTPSSLQVVKRRENHQCINFSYPVASVRCLRHRVPSAGSAYRRRRNMFPRRLHRKNNLMLSARPKISQHRKRLCRPKTALMMKNQLLLWSNLSEQMETVSGYSSDVSSYPDPERSTEANDGTPLIHPVSLPPSGCGNISISLLDSSKNSLQNDKISPSSQSQHKISNYSNM